MEKYAWRGKVKDGKIAEYKRRHDEIWSEMITVLKQAGIKNYTIWLSGNDLFGYYECEKGVAYATNIQSVSPVVKKMGRLYERYSYNGKGSRYRCTA